MSKIFETGLESGPSRPKSKRPSRPTRPTRPTRTSRIGSALERVRSVEAHPPHQAHFDIPERAPSPITPASTPGIPGAGEDEKASADIPIGDKLKLQETDEKGKGKGKALLVDIEHAPCDDDPREWSKGKKNLVLGMMIVSVVGPMINPSIYNPVINEVKSDLHANDAQIALSLSLYILFQGWCPIIWATIAEIIGRKIVYIVSYAIYTLCTVIASRSTNIATLIVMRLFQAWGSSAVISIGAGSLADLYEVQERGRKLGLFYGVPMAGFALGPLIGGALGNAFGWRSALYFLSVFAGINCIMFIFFPDTWRKERSRVYQVAVQNAIKRAMHHEEVQERKRRESAPGHSTSRRTSGLDLVGVTSSKSNEQSDLVSPSSTLRDAEPGLLVAEHPQGLDGPMPLDNGPALANKISPVANRNIDSADTGISIEHDKVKVNRRRWFGLWKPKVVSSEAKIRPSLRDVNPLPSMWAIVKRPGNNLVLVGSGLFFSAQYCIPYTASLTLAKPPYNYNALNIGLVILAFGIGNIVGSIIGGRLSDRYLRRVRKRNGGINVPESRLKSTIPSMPLLVASFFAYAWTAGEHVNIAGVTVSLFFCGLSIMLIYSSTLAYLVDANPGRSASAVASNSFFRGVAGCVFSQVAAPIQNAIGDQGLYSLVAGLLAVACLLLSLVAFKGEAWRSPDHTWPWSRKKGKLRSHL